MNRRILFAFSAALALGAFQSNALAQPEVEAPLAPVAAPGGATANLQARAEATEADYATDDMVPPAPQLDMSDDMPAPAVAPAYDAPTRGMGDGPCGGCGVPAPAAEIGCRKLVPCHYTTQCDIVEVPACMGTRRVRQFETAQVPCMATRRIPQYTTVELPVYKTRNVPVMTTRRVPRYENVQVPCFATRQIPQYTTIQIPVWKTREVPVMTTRSVPQTRMVCDECTGETRAVVCGYTVEQVQCGTRAERYQDGARTEQRLCGYKAERYQSGTRTERRLAGFDSEQVQCGVRAERYRDGTRSEQRLCGFKTETYQTGTRSERRFVGYENESFVIRAASSRVVSRRVLVPAQWVTVAPDGQTELAELQEGTTEVLSQSEYDRAILVAGR